jgi:hypothetical protein
MLTGDRWYLARRTTAAFGAVTRGANCIETFTGNRVRRTRAHGRHSRLFFVARLRGATEGTCEYGEQNSERE